MTAKQLAMLFIEPIAQRLERWLTALALREIDFQLALIKRDRDEGFAAERYLHTRRMRLLLKNNEK